MKHDIRARLEHLRKELRAERISYGELAELQSLASVIPASDTELLQAAGVPEHGAIWSVRTYGAGGKFTGYLSHRNRKAWAKRTAQRHAREFTARHGGRAELELHNAP